MTACRSPRAWLTFFVVLVGAAALLFSVGLFTWRQVAIMLMGNCVAILLATVLNNLNSKRQYPTFWGIGYIKDLLTCINGKSLEEDKKIM